MEKIKKISIVIPVLNEQESLPVLFERTLAVCQRLERDYEIIFIDDGSEDHSAEMITTFAERDNVIAVLLNRNYGQHAAIMAGFKQVSGDLIITLDADLQNPPEEIVRLVEVAEQGYDVVGSVRTHRQDSWFRKTASLLLNRLIQKTTGKVMTDYGCMLRAYRRAIIDAMLACHERSTFIPILANIFAKKTTEIQVQHAERVFGESKYNLFSLLNLMCDLLTCLTTTPLRLLSLFGGTIALLGFILALFLIVMRLIFGPVWAAGGVFTLFAVLFIFIGMQFIGMGLLGEYIGRIYNDVRARPRYFIQKVIRKSPTNKEKE